MDFPTRLPKFIGRQSVRVPQDVKLLSAQAIRDFDFKRMGAKYICLRNALAEIGLEFQAMGWEEARSGQGFTAWVGPSEDPIFIWHKMSGGVPGVAGNSCFSKYAQGKPILTAENQWRRTPQELLQDIIPCELKRAILWNNSGI